MSSGWITTIGSSSSDAAWPSASCRIVIVLASFTKTSNPVRAGMVAMTEGQIATVGLTIISRGVPTGSPDPLGTVTAALPDRLLYAFMPGDRLLSIASILSVVLAGGAGCGRRQALSAPEVPTVGTSDARDSGSDSSATHDGETIADATITLDASGAPDAAIDLDAIAAPPSLPPNQYRVIALAVGRTHNCVILDDHKVKCWGDNASGQLGLGDTKDRGADPATMGDNLPTLDLGTGRTAKSLTAGRYATCAILDDDTLKCWGIRVPVGPDNNATDEVGNQPGEMGDNLKPVDLGAGRKPVAVAIGWSETCVALDDGSSLCWSGTPTTKVAAAADGARVVQLAQDVETIGLFDDGSVRRISLNFPDGPTPVDFGGPATFVAGASTGGQFDCVILRTGSTACIPPQNPPIMPLDASVVAVGLTEYESPCGLDAAGVVTCWRIQYHPEWGGGTTRVPLDQPATAIGAGDYNSCALLADGTVKCWAMDGTYPLSLGGSVSTSNGWPSVDLGTRPAP